MHGAGLVIDQSNQWMKECDPQRAIAVLGFWTSVAVLRSYAYGMGLFDGSYVCFPHDSINANAITTTANFINSSNTVAVEESSTRA